MTCQHFNSNRTNRKLRKILANQKRWHVSATLQDSDIVHLNRRLRVYATQATMVKFWFVHVRLCRLDKTGSISFTDSPTFKLNLIYRNSIQCLSLSGNVYHELITFFLVKISPKLVLMNLFNTMKYSVFVWLKEFCRSRGQLSTSADNILHDMHMQKQFFSSTNLVDKLV